MSDDIKCVEILHFPLFLHTQIGPITNQCCNFIYIFKHVTQLASIAAFSLMSVGPSFANIAPSAYKTGQSKVTPSIVCCGHHYYLAFTKQSEMAYTFTYTDV